MSRSGRIPIAIPENTEVKVDEGLINLDADFFQDSASLSLNPAITIYQQKTKKKEKPLLKLLLYKRQMAELYLL